MYYDNVSIYEGHKVVVANAFSLQMLEKENQMVLCEDLPLEVAKEMITSAKTLQSIIGHEDTAKVASNLFGVELPMNRVNYTMNWSEYLLVLQVVGGRLPEGATELPEGITFKCKLVTLASPCSFCAAACSGECRSNGECDCFPEFN